MTSEEIETAWTNEVIETVSPVTATNRKLYYLLEGYHGQTYNFINKPEGNVFVIEREGEYEITYTDDVYLGKSPNLIEAHVQPPGNGWEFMETELGTSKWRRMCLWKNMYYWPRMGGFTFSECAPGHEFPRSFH